MRHVKTNFLGWYDERAEASASACTYLYLKHQANRELSLSYYKEAENAKHRALNSKITGYGAKCICHQSLFFKPPPNALPITNSTCMKVPTIRNIQYQDWYHNFVGYRYSRTVTTFGEYPRIVNRNWPGRYLPVRGTAVPTGTRKRCSSLPFRLIEPKYCMPIMVWHATFLRSACHHGRRFKRCPPKIQLCLKTSCSIDIDSSLQKRA